jgi:hypothetical protein
MEVPDSASRDAKCGHDILEKIHISEKLNRSWFVLLRRVAAQQMPIAILSHPFGASQMTVERMSRAIRLPIWINMQHDPRHVAPVSTLGVSVKQPQVSHQMFLIVTRQCRGGWRHVSNIGIEREFLHWHPVLENVAESKP